MSPRSVCEATVHPPAHTGMKAQPSHAFHAASWSNLRAAAERRSLDVPSMWPVESDRSPVNPGQAYRSPSGPIVYACLRWISHGPMCTPSEVANPCFFVSSRRKDIWSSANWHVSHAPVTEEAPAPADVMQVPFNAALL